MDERVKTLEFCVSELLDGISNFAKTQRSYYDVEHEAVMAEACEELYELVENIKEYLR